MRFVVALGVGLTTVAVAALARAGNGNGNGRGNGGGNGGGGNSLGCPQVEQWIHDLSSPDDDKRLHACRALRQVPWNCDATSNGTGGGGSSESANHKLKIIDASAAPDPFSPEPDGFLDTTTLTTDVEVRRTDASNGEPARAPDLDRTATSFSFQTAATWTLFSTTSGAAVRVLTASAPITFDRGAVVLHGNGPATLSTSLAVIWDGRDESGALEPDGTYSYTLEVEYLRESAHTQGFAFGSSQPDQSKVIASATIQGTVTIDESVGEALRKAAEQALIARLSDPDISVRRAAITTLEVVGREASIQPLAGVLTNSGAANDPLTAGLAALPLAQIRRTAGIDTEPELQAALATTTSQIERSIIIRSLATTYDKSLLPQLTALRDDTGQPALIREAARRAVLTLENTDAAP